MAEQQKTVDVAAEHAAPIVAQETPVAPEVAPLAADTTVVPADTTADESKPVEAVAADETVPAVEEKKEVKPVEEGLLGYKAQGMSFPKNLIPSKEFFFFGSDAVEPKSLAGYQKTEKHAGTAHSNIAWASHTGKGLLFFGDKKAPSSMINLAHANEPEVDGSNKFHFSTKGNKHSFKAATVAERDGWVAQLKLKIAEAKELATQVTESETYKKTMETLKPTPIAPKEEKVADAPKDEAVKAEEPAAVEEAAKEDEAVKEEPKEEAAKVEEPKRRSASRKRASFFGFGKKEESKVEEPTKEAPVAPEETPIVAEPVVAETEAPKTEEIPATETAAPLAEEKSSEEAAIPAESPKEKSSASKRNSFFGGVFSKKEKKAADAKPLESPEATTTEGETVPAAETAPVIPPVEATTPLAVDVSNPATVPTETVEIPAAGEAKKDVKDVKERRKSSMGFAFGKREKSPAPVDGEEKQAKASPFSKLRATIKGKGAAKAEEKPAEEAAKDEAVKEEAAPAAKDETVTEEAAKADAPATEAEAENKPENVAAVAPAVTAAA